VASSFSLPPARRRNWLKSPCSIAAEDPRPGARIQIGGIEAKITAIGDKAWDKVREIGHVVVNFNGASAADRPGEICAEEVDGAALVAALVAGSEIAISA
jgi:PTS system glucitol/sorbitol-specific IIA component